MGGGVTLVRNKEFLFKTVKGVGQKSVELGCKDDLVAFRTTLAHLSQNQTSQLLSSTSVKHLKF